MTGAQIILTLQVDYGLGDETILAILADYIDHFCNPEHALEYLLDRADPEPDSDGTTEEHNPIPADWPVQPLKPGEEAERKATCGHCGLSWDDGKVTGMTPAPSARCPFETFHIYIHFDVVKRMSIEVYAFEDADGNSASDWTTQDIELARRFAREHGYRLIVRIFEFSDSELVEDNTEKDEEDDDDGEET